MKSLLARKRCRQWEPGFGLKARLLKLRFAAPASISDTHEAALRLRFAAPASISNTDEAVLRLRFVALASNSNTVEAALRLRFAAPCRYL